jgi:uncharacterized protein (TIGR02996 family)
VTDAAAFIRAVIAAPADDLPRLVYADFLDERGDPRGEFVRVQVELAKCPPEIRADRRWHDLRYACAGPDGRKWDDLRFREDAILRTMQWREWAGSVLMELWNDRIADQTLYGQRHLPQAFTFTRGFVSAVALSWADWRTHAKQLLAAAPIARVNRPRACGACGGRRLRLPGATLGLPCLKCRGTGMVDDWKGDGRVILTTIPMTETRGDRFSDRQDRLRGCETWYWRRADRSPNWSAPNDDDTPDRRVIRGLLAAEYPGVDFALLEPRGVDGLTAREVAERMNAASAAILRRATYQAILADAPEARP